jgi:DNA-3-methyladenine glycosylase I
MNIPHQGLHKGNDGLVRCWWCGDDPFYQHYHDHEWGYPVYDERKLYEKICLEGFQSGLSWLTILRKRENFRKAFADFDVRQVARFGEADVERLMQDTGIVRNRRKIEAAITNARAVCAMMDHGESLSSFFWAHKPQPAERPAKLTYDVVQTLTETPVSKEISKQLKAMGFVFVGPITMYAHMQAMGLVNDHLEGCHVRNKIKDI